MTTIHIERHSDGKTYWLREDGCAAPFGYIERAGHQWWASIPGGDVHGYFHTRSQAIAALV